MIVKQTVGVCGMLSSFRMGRLYHRDYTDFYGVGKGVPSIDYSG